METLNVQRLKQERADLEAQWYQEWKAKRKNQQKSKRKAEKKQRIRDMLEMFFSAFVWLGIITASGVQAGSLLRGILPTNVWFNTKDDLCDDWDPREARWN
eukprot:Gregarina_sp_Pseudo_9__987@NODE_1635_length_1436_cov_74_730136_g1515_i0_p3_GENE_NODE_1635_length_1436_cov_74_730136_g1515_i0NODE_1635_length_1436_cov_74_730136_g1515_i0_p3_ORF_typecomplete_len101_score19_06Ada3/PF10198_9/0_0053DUF2458/PF10454_9/0_13ZapB/PF06005_12/0_18Peptidase_S49_N/PF08496_10/0_14DUF4207/PF13904_6/0_24_NODE_1635_length_1436_cov_74_730136_g1515_i0145447